LDAVIRHVLTLPPRVIDTGTMANQGTGVVAPGLLVGEAVEDWTGDALFYEYTKAADPIGSGAITRVPIVRFSPGLHAGGPTRLVPLDNAAALGVDYPATSPGLLAAFVVIEPQDSLRTTPEATSELYYCLAGEGTSSFTRSDRTGGVGSGVLAWRPGDFITLPAGCTTVHASGEERSLLYRVTDAPLLAYLGATPNVARFEPTRFDGEEARARLAEVLNDPTSARRSRISVLLANTATPQTLTVTHTLWAMLGVLPVDRVQRPHRHQSVALDLIVDCAPGCYSLVGFEVDEAGDIVDPTRVDWESAGAFVTPPGMWHSHHNESGRPAYLIPIQDAGLHTYLRSLDIRFVPTDD
jgi:gentisate 1,2-dioxygenase